jgi:RNA-directed DNA polymerase
VDAAGAARLFDPRKRGPAIRGPRFSIGLDGRRLAVTGGAVAAPAGRELRKSRAPPGRAIFDDVMGFLDWLGRLFGGMPARPRHPNRPPRPTPAQAPANEARLRELGLPPIRDGAQLAADMRLSTSDLLWLSDPGRIAAKRAPHYRLLLRRKKDGSFRPLLAPKRRLKAAQTWILRNLLDRVPPSREAHGFASGRSIATHAAAHVGRDVVLHADLKDFFHRFTLRDVTRLFRSFGYSGDVAWTLGLLTTAPIRAMLPSLAARARQPLPDLRRAIASSFLPGLPPMLPQGSPTSPAISNLLCRRLDARLAGLASAFEADYTRYADDLAFSGRAEFRRDLPRFIPLLKGILRDHRLPLAPAKLRVARKGSRQLVTGLVVNRKVNVPASAYRELRAILHNCLKTGPAPQNRGRVPDFRQHLQGRISFLASIHPKRGERLRQAFAHIDW